ncbi:MAG: choice-of-anchor P family protein [Nocardioidaceae bacterium]
MIGKFLATAAALSLTASGLLLVGTSAGASTGTVAAATPTTYALSASGYASRVHGGGVPADSGATAFQIIGCTDQAGLSKTNTQASITLQGIGTLSAAKTHVWTTNDNGVVSSWSRNSISKVVFVDSGLGVLSLDGIVSLSQASHDASGFHARTKPTLGTITLTVAGIDTHFPVPPPGQSVTIPGVATITVGAGTRTQSAHGASALLDAVTVELIPTNTTVYLGHSRANIHDGIKSGVFGGSAYGTQLTVVGGVGQVGQTPRIVMPCQGTNGKVRVRTITGVSLPGVGSVSGLSASELANQTQTNAHAWERGKVAKATLAAGSLVITGVRGEARATYTVGSSVIKDTNGTTLAKVVFNGQVLQFPARGPLVIPGVASLTPKIVHRTPNGIEVTALQVKLLNGSGATINLGHAKVKVTPSGL